MRVISEVETRVLKLLKLGVSRAISKELLMSEVMVRDQNPYINEIVLSITGYIWSEKIGSEEVQWPKDWWEHFKQRWFPGWALKRWPVKMEKRVFVAKALYPNYKAIPEKNTGEYRIAIFPEVDYVDDGVWDS